MSLLDSYVKPAFRKLESDKKNLILQVTRGEFSLCSYREASLNRILSDTEISKGGMYKYVDSKLNLYLAAAACTLEELSNYQNGHFSPGITLQDHLRNLIHVSLDFHRKNPTAYRHMLRLSLETDPEAVNGLKQLRSKAIRELTVPSFANRKADEREEKIIEWFLAAFNTLFLKYLSEREDTDLVESILIPEMEMLLSVIQCGLENLPPTV